LSCRYDGICVGTPPGWLTSISMAHAPMPHAGMPQKCNRCSWVTCLDDVKFVEQILNAMEADYCIDLQRVHATGYSNGGQMAYQVSFSD